MAVVFLFAASVAQASLIGDEVFVDWVYPDGSGVIASDSGVVTADSSDILGGALFFDQIGVDVNDSSIDFVAFVSGPFDSVAFNGFRVYDLDWVDTIGSITGFNITTNTLTNYDPTGNVTFGNDWFQVNFAGANVTQGTFFAVDLLTTHAVPEPATLLLFGAGLAAVGYRRRRAQR